MNIYTLSTFSLHQNHSIYFNKLYTKHWFKWHLNYFYWTNPHIMITLFKLTYRHLLPLGRALWPTGLLLWRNWIVGTFLETLDIWHQFEPTCFLVIQSMYTVNVIPAYQILPHGDRLDSLFNLKMFCISFSSMFHNVYNSYSVFVKSCYSFIFKFVLIFHSSSVFICNLY